MPDRLRECLIDGAIALISAYCVGPELLIDRFLDQSLSRLKGKGFIIFFPDIGFIADFTNSAKAVGRAADWSRIFSYQLGLWRSGSNRGSFRSRLVVLVSRRADSSREHQKDFVQVLRAVSYRFQRCQLFEHHRATSGRRMGQPPPAAARTRARRHLESVVHRPRIIST